MHDPERYETSKTVVSRDAELYIPKMIKDMTWRRNESILDFGCGTGSTGAHFILPKVKSTDSKMYSVDISQEMIEYAKEKFPDPRVTYAAGNILTPDFPFKDMQFDKIFSFYVLHFIKDFRAALRRFYKFLKPGGQMGFTVATSTPVFFMHQKLGRDPKWSEYLKGYEEFVPEWIEKQEDARKVFQNSLEDIGFSILDLSVTKKEFVYEKFESMLDFTLSVNPFIKEIPSDLQLEFRNEHREFLKVFLDLEQNGVEGNRMSYEALYAVVQK